MRAPDGYESGSIGGTQYVARRGLAAFLRAAIESSGSLHVWAAANSEAAMPGRGAAHVIASPQGRLVVRHYRRGGGMRALGDRYVRIARPRPFHEMEISTAARSRGIPTPAVAAVTVHPAGVFYRGDIATDYVPDSETLADVGLGGSRRSEGERHAAWRAAGRLVRVAADRGLAHADLNVRNVLIEWRPDGPAAHLLDLDRCDIVDRTPAQLLEPMVARLRRSVRKLEERIGVSGADSLAAFDEGTRG